MDIEKLKLFAEVARYGSISRASVALGSAPSAISRNVSLLERDCGGRLFYRTGRGVALTELGARILSRIKEPLRVIDQVAEEVQATAGELVGTVRLGVLAAVARPLVSSLFPTLRTKHPGVRLCLVQGTSGQLDELLANRQIDLAVVTRNRRAAVRNEPLLAVLDAYLIGAKGDALTSGPSVKFARLDRIPLILQGMHTGLRIAIEANARAKRITLQVVMETDALSILKDIVVDGGGYMVSTLPAVEREVEAGNLQASRIVSPAIPRFVTLAMAKPASAACREVAKIVRSTVSWDRIGRLSRHASVRNG